MIKIILSNTLKLWAVLGPQTLGVHGHFDGHAHPLFAGLENLLDIKA